MMSSSRPLRSWWQALADFAKALDDVENHSPHDALSARLGRLEVMVSELVATNERLVGEKSPRASDPDFVSVKRPEGQSIAS